VYSWVASNGSIQTVISSGSTNSSVGIILSTYKFYRTVSPLKWSVEKKVQEIVHKKISQKEFTKKFRKRGHKKVHQ